MKSNKRLYLIAYWFISSKHRQETFQTLEKIRNKFPLDSLRIVALNPFDRESDIALFQESSNYGFEMESDRKGSSIFYGINVYPSFILMENNGKILSRHSGIGVNTMNEITGSILKHDLKSDTPVIPLYHPDTITKYKINLSHICHNK